MSNQNQDSARTNIDSSSVRFGCTHIRLISQEFLKISVRKFGLTNTLVKLFVHIWGTRLILPKQHNREEKRVHTFVAMTMKPSSGIQISESNESVGHC